MNGNPFERLQVELGERMRERRQLLGLDQASLAEISGVSRHTVSNLESAKGNPTLSVLAEVCDALGMEVQFELRIRGGVK